jgi:hypothetical protein
MTALILAGLIVGAVAAAAVVTGFLEYRRRRSERLAAQADRASRSEPIPTGWPRGSTLSQRSPAP